MSSSSQERDGGDEVPPQDATDEDEVEDGNDDVELQREPTRESTISHMLEEEIAAGRAEKSEPTSTVNAFKSVHIAEAPQEDALVEENIAPRVESPAGSLPSIPDDTPSVHGSIGSSPGSSVRPSLASRPGLDSPTPSFRPFDRRFSSFLRAPSGVYSPRSQSPAFLAQTHARQASGVSQMLLDKDETESPSPPWEVVRWTKLKKLNGQAFSEIGRRNFGTPTCIGVSASIVLGTSKGIILVFDYHQNLKSIIGPGTKAVESGAITSLSISADHSTVAGGHANGDIFTWEIAKAARPFLHIPRLDAAQMQNRTVDGHCPGVAITHLSFLGTRHTALVSADDRGMGFSHLATRGTGSVGRRVKTTRILGRYPNDASSITTGKPRKPSTILAFASLPLGNVERATDTLGLTAMLTPYLLVIVSTTPIAETQHKAARPKEIAAHSAMSGCLAWFPGVKLKVRDPETGQTVSKAKLVYCWSNVLTVMDIEEYEVEGDKLPGLSFKARSRWKSEEAIVAVQWLSRSVLAVLTITQRLIILEDNSMRMTEAFDLLNKHIYHKDMFSDQLHALVEQLDEEDSSMHGVVADAFYMSFKAYKGRMFLLGFNDVSIGAVSSWADRLIALMEDGDYIGAIHLATAYFTGDADKLTIGLPEDTELRHGMVRDKLVEIMTASLKFAFGSGKESLPQEERENELRELAEACFQAASALGDTDYLFDDVYEWYDDGKQLGIFFDILEPYIQEEEIIMLPPIVVKALVAHYVEQNQESLLEELLCRLETATFDIDQITTLCKQHKLYDALIYLWSQALGDYITPLIDLLKLLLPMVQSEEYLSNNDIEDHPVYGVLASKMFPYLSYTFTGRVYPTGEPMTQKVEEKAKSELYWFLFSGNSIVWPEGSSKPFLTLPDGEDKPSFPYLRMILKYDAPSLLSCLNEAFEDSFLNDTPDNQDDHDQSSTEYELFGRSINRQYIVSILLEVMSPANFAPEDTIYLDMFIARNLAKFSQYLLLSGSSLHTVLTGLCNYPGEDIADDAQLSAEYLLSVYHPSDIQSLIPLFENAGFYRVLKTIYKADKQYARLIQTYFDDSQDQETVFDCIADCLRPENLSQKQVRDIHDMIRKHAREIVFLDAVKAAHLIDVHAPELHGDILSALSDDSHEEYLYLQTLLEPPADSIATQPSKTASSSDFIESYVRLLCIYDSTHVASYVESLSLNLSFSSHLRLDRILPAMEESGVIDAAVILMAREGLVTDAMGRLTAHLGKLEAALSGLLASAEGKRHEPDNLMGAAEELLEALQKYTGVGIWLCTKNSKAQSAWRPKMTKAERRKSMKATELTSQEELWLELIDKVVQVTKTISASLTSLAEASEDLGSLNLEKLRTSLRTLVQRTFTALLTATSGPSGSSLSFLRILRAFLTRASLSSPTINELRSVLASIFSAYAYEESILGLANRLLDKDLFVNVEDADKFRRRGWRPRGSLCEGCKRRVWGPGCQGDILGAWEEAQQEDEVKRQERRILRASGNDVAVGKGKRAVPPRTASQQWLVDKTVPRTDGADEEEVVSMKEDLGPLVVFACRHLYHQTCLKRQLERQKGELGEWYKGFKCPIDG